MPKLLKVKEWTETKKCQATVRRACILAVPVTFRVGVTKMFAVRMVPCTAPSAPTQRLSRPPPIQNLGTENHMLKLNI